MATRRRFIGALLLLGHEATAAPLREVEVRYLAPPKTELYSTVSSLALLPPGYQLSGNCTPEPIDSRFYAPALTGDAHAEVSRLFGWTDMPPQSPMRKATVRSRISYITSFSFLGPMPKPVVQVAPAPGTRNAYRLVESSELTVALASAGHSLKSLGKSALVKVAVAAKVDGVMSVGVFLRKGSEDHTVRVTVEGRICTPPRHEVWEQKVEGNFSPSVVQVQDGQPVESSVRASLRPAISSLVQQAFGATQVHPAVVNMPAPGGRCGRQVLKAMQAGSSVQVVREQLTFAKDDGRCDDSEAALLDGLIGFYEGKPDQAVSALNLAYESSGRQTTYNDARISAATLQRAVIEVQRYSQARLAIGLAAEPEPTGGSSTGRSSAAVVSSEQELMNPFNPETGRCPAWMTLGPLMVVAVGSSEVTSRCDDTLARCADTLLDSETRAVMADFELGPEDMTGADMARLVAQSTKAKQVVILKDDGGKLIVQRLSVNEDGDFKDAGGCAN